ncbi:MAG TPA: hypothetical protein VFY45_23365 [Baekduia sp.]|nr:hypothetical protein [Baekduia sp.]
MPEEPTAPTQPQPPPGRRRRVPSARRFAAGALASFVAIFGVLALRVHDGDDPALASVAKKTTSTTSTSTSTTSSDPYDPSSGDDSSSSSSSSGDSSGAVSSTPGASTSAS